MVPRVREQKQQAGEASYEERDSARELGQTVRERMRSRGNDRWRRDKWHLGMALGPVLLAIGLCCAEAALAIGGYLVAYALFLDRGSWRVRPLTLLPYATLVLPWLVALLII